MNDERWTTDEGSVNFGWPIATTHRSLNSDREYAISTPNSGLRTHYSELSNSGMSLVEVIAVLAIIGILAVVVLPKIDFGSTSSMASVNGAAYMVASDIRYAQEFAMANRVSKSVIFSTLTPTVYTFSPTSGLDSSGRLPSGVTILDNLTITFNSLGEPVSIPPATPPTSYVSVRVSAGGQNKEIRIQNFTGKVSIRSIP